MTANSDSLDRRWDDQLFGIRRSIRYHNHRRAFFDQLDQVTNAVSVIFGSAAVYGVLERNVQWLAILSAGIVTILSAIALVVGTTRRAREHWDLSRRFTDLEKSMSVAPSEEALIASQKVRLEIESDEPPALLVLNCIVHNELMRAEGHPREDFAKITGTQRFWAPFFDWRSDTIDG